MKKLQTRKDRLLYLLETKQLNDVQYAKALNVNRYHMYRHLRQKQEINSMHYIKTAYVLLQGKVSYQWLITGRPPFEGYPNFLREESESKFYDRVIFLLNRVGLSFEDINKQFGLNKTTFIGRLQRKDVNVNNIIFLHLITGLSIDYILDGVGPEYAWEGDSFELSDLLGE